MIDRCMSFQVDALSPSHRPVCLPLPEYVDRDTIKPLLLSPKASRKILTKRLMIVL